MKPITLVAALQIVLTFATSQAESLPWIRNLSNGATITIPAGKILIIEQISNPDLAQASGRFTVAGPEVGGVGTGSFSTDFRIQLDGFDLQKLESPLRLGPGMSITSVAGAGLPPRVVLFGTVIDTSDFIASADPVLKGATLESGKLAAVIDSRTSKPTTTVGEASNDLQTWSATGVSVAKSSSNPRVSKIITPADAPKKFVRAKIVAHALSKN